MRASVTMLCAAMLAGCFNPDDILPIKGSVEGAGQRLQLSRAPNPRGGDCTDWKQLKTAESQDDGSFVFDVFRAQATSLTTYESFCFQVETTYDNGSHLSSVVEQLYGEAQLLPFPRWAPNLRRENGEFRFSSLRERDASLIVQHTLEVKRSGQTVWRAVDLGLGGLSEQPTPRRLLADPRIYDELGGEASVRGSYAEVPTQVEGPIESQILRPPVDAFAMDVVTLGATQRPPSRGADCEELPSPCGLTDGELTGVELGGATSMTVKLSQPLVPSLVVLRALVTSSPVLAVWGTQADGGVVPYGAFALLRDGDPLGAQLPDGRYEPAPTFVALPLDGGVEVMAVSVGAESLERVDEVSVW